MEQVIGVFGDFSEKEFASEERAVEAGCQYLLGPRKKKSTWRKGVRRTIDVRELYSPHGKLIGAMAEGRWKLHDVFLHGSGWIVDHTLRGRSTGLPYVIAAERWLISKPRRLGGQPWSAGSIRA